MRTIVHEVGTRVARRYGSGMAHMRMQHGSKRGVQQAQGDHNIIPPLCLKIPASIITSVETVRYWVSGCICVAMITFVEGAVVVRVTGLVALEAVDVGGGGEVFATVVSVVNYDCV